MQHISRLGKLQYQTKDGIITFPGDITTDVSARNVRSTCGRYVKYTDYTLTMDGYLYADDVAGSSTVDNAFQLAHKIMSQSGGILTMEDRGIGNMYINRDSSVGRDINFGPHPDIMTWKPVGNIFCTFKWQVTFRLPCNRAVYTRPGILEFTWKTVYEYDEAGFCTRTVSGMIEVAGGRYGVGNPNITQNDNAETYIKSLVICDCPLGYHRLKHQLDINESKLIGNFTFVDKQDESDPLPPGMADFDFTHTLRTQANSGSLCRWIWSVTVKAKPIAREQAWTAYSACITAHQHRFNFMIARLVNTQTGIIIPLPMEFVITENRKTRETTLVAAWILTVTGGNQGNSPTDILYRSGLWQPFPWTAEQTKLANDLPLGPNVTGGMAQLTADPSQNSIVDISGFQPNWPNVGKSYGIIKRELGPPEDFGFVSPYGLYIEFNTWFSAKTAGGQWVNYPLTDQLLPKDKRGFRQKIHEQYNEYYFCGVLTRVGIPPAGVPILKQIDGIPVYKIGEGYVHTELVQVFCGTPTYRTVWKIPYNLGIQDDGNPIKANAADLVRSRNVPQMPKDEAATGSTQADVSGATGP